MMPIHEQHFPASIILTGGPFPSFITMPPHSYKKQTPCYKSGTESAQVKKVDGLCGIKLSKIF